jgi:release factor glutamine methyltransferase
MKTVARIYERSVARLKKAGIPDPETDARALIAARLGVERASLSLNKRTNVGRWNEHLIARDIRRRARFEPVAYILGYKDFFQDRFSVSRGSLIPRADTEHLLYAVQNTGRKFSRAIDIGTGSGAIAVSLSRLFPDSAIYAVDKATRHARKNIDKLGTSNIQLVKADFLKTSSLLPGKTFDLIVSNPPYLSDLDLKNLGKDARLYEPFRAFYGGPDGHLFYRKIADFARERLEEGGIIVLETDHKWETVKGIFQKAGFPRWEMIRDYNGLERVLVISK